METSDALTSSNFCQQSWAAPSDLPHWRHHGQKGEIVEQAVWRQVRGDLTSTRRSAAMFLDDFDDAALGRQGWIAEWTKIGDDHCLLADLKIKRGDLDEATEASLCALTAFEVARRLVDQDDPQSEIFSAKIEASIAKSGLSLWQKLERVQVTFCDDAEIPAYYLPSNGSDLGSPAVICISSEQETAATLLGRLLPVVIGRGMSILVVAHDHFSNCSREQSNALLSCCLDFLSGRAEIDAARIGVYGEGLAAVLATELASFDRRVAAAVCDGGLWNWLRITASVGWMTGASDEVDEDAISTLRSHSIRALKCPILVVTGGRGIVSVSEALKLQADCAPTRIDLELVIPRKIRSSGEDIEDFVTSDNCIFAWLQRRLTHSSAVAHCRPKRPDR